MLFIANARGLRVSKCVLGSRVGPKRLASLTGAIQRGVRKARDIVGRGKPQDARSDLRIYEGFERRPKTIPHRVGPIGQQNEGGQFQQRGHIRENQRQSSYFQRDSDGTPRSHRRTERTAPREGDHSRSSGKQVAWKSTSQPSDRDQDGSRLFKEATDHLRQGLRRGGVFTIDEADRSPLSQRNQSPLRYVSEQAEPRSPTVERHVRVPLSIPRTAAASEFIYGTTAVKAALQAGTRKLYKLYVHQGAIDLEGGDRQISNLAQKHGVHIKRLVGEGLRLLDKMAQGRPHNGFILEASHLPNTPAKALESVAGPGEEFSFKTGHQSAEDLEVNGVSNKISVSGRRYPFILMLDSILDPGNLGAIIRSAAFFGVDAVALLDYNLAPFSPVTLKASAGAAEFMRFLKIKNDHDFVTRSQSNGWKFFAAVAPQSASAKREGSSAVPLKDAEDALSKGPSVLMLGGEGGGLRHRLQKAADGLIGIEGAGSRNAKFGLDSLNVSVAAALMMQTFLRGSAKDPLSSIPAPESKASTNDEKLF